MTTQEAERRFAELLARVRDDADEIVIAENGVAVARLAPPIAPLRRVPGQDVGKIVIAPDFDAPLQISRLAEQCARLNPAEEQALAEEGLSVALDFPRLG